MQKIKKGQEKLTPEQEAYAKEFAQKCIKAYLSTDKVDEQVAEYHLANAYKVAGLDAPQVIWTDSPEQFIKIWDSVGASVWASVRTSIRYSVLDSVGASVWASVRTSVWDSVGASVWASVRTSVWDSVGASVWAWYDSDDFSFYGFFNEQYEENKLSHLFELSKMVNGYYFGKEKALLCRKPTTLKLIDNKLHSEKGKAIEWCDGYGFYFLHGIRFDEQLWKSVVDKTITAKEAMKIENTEQRAVVIKLLGTKKVLDELGSEVIDKSEYHYGTDYLLQLKDFKDSVGDDYKILKGFDPAENDYVYIRVSPECKTVQEAQTFAYQLYGLNITYQPTKRT